MRLKGIQIDVHMRWRLPLSCCRQNMGYLHGLLDGVGNWIPEPLQVPHRVILSGHQGASVVIIQAAAHRHSRMDIMTGSRTVWPGDTAGRVL